MKREYGLILSIVLGLVVTVGIARWNDSHRDDLHSQFAEEQLYLNGPAMKRVTLAFNGLAADWYWLRSLQYVGRKIVNYEDTHNGRFNLSNLASLDLRLLPHLLRMCTTLDPQFMEAYYYGALILPDLDPQDAISLVNYGIRENPNDWRLYQHLGYIYWQRADYLKAGEVYEAGAKTPNAPKWMLAMGARMKAEGGDAQNAREMYLHLYESSDDDNVKNMVRKHLMRLDSIKERAKMRTILSEYAKRAGHCPASWKEISATLKGAGLRIDNQGAPLDPSDTPYQLSKDGCHVELADTSIVPKM